MKIIGFLCVLLMPIAGYADEERGGGKRKQDLTVLYAGDPEDARTADFERFLGEHFKSVGPASYEEFTPEAMDGYDVWSKDAGRKITTIEVEEPSPENPIEASAAILEPSAGKGDTVTLVVRVKIAKGWHIYAEVPEGSPLPVSELTLKLPEGIKAKGDWKLPESVEKDDFKVYQRDLVFSRKLVVGEGPKYLATVQCALHFQACDKDLCMPPGEQQWSLHLPIRR